MKKYFVCLLWVLLAMPVMASTIRIYVANQDSGSLDVIDPVTNKVVQTIGGMISPDEAVFSPDGSRAYVPDQDGRVLNVVDTKTGKSIKKVRLSGMPNLPAITNDGKRLFIAIWAVSDVTHNVAGTCKCPRNESVPGCAPCPPLAGAVDIVDTTTLEKVKTLPMKGPMHDIFITPDGKYMLAGTPHGIAVIDATTENPVWNWESDPKGLGPTETLGYVMTFAIESKPDGSTGRVFVELGGLNGFAVLDFAKRKEVSRVTFPVPTFGYEIEPTHGTGITPDGKSLWVCSRGSNNVFVYSLPDLKLLGQIYLPELEVPGPLGKGASPQWITFTPDGKRAYIPLATTGAVYVVDVETRKEVARIRVGKNPRHTSTLVIP